MAENYSEPPNKKALLEIRENREKSEENEENMSESVQNLQWEGKKEVLEIREDENDHIDKMTSESVKKFSFRNIFPNFSKMQLDKKYECKDIEYYGVEWHFGVVRRTNCIEIALYYRPAYGYLLSSTWNIQFEFFTRCILDGGLLFSDIRQSAGVHSENPIVTQWHKLEKTEDVGNDELVVESRIIIKAASGIHKNNIISFDESKKEFSDMVLKVGAQKFFVAKLFIASHSPYFQALFSSAWNDNESEISLKGVDPEDFQKFMEVLYGAEVIDDTNVEGVLLLADMYDTKIVAGKCENFLMKRSNKSVDKKREIAKKYGMQCRFWKVT